MPASSPVLWLPRAEFIQAVAVTVIHQVPAEFQETLCGAGVRFGKCVYDSRALLPVGEPVDLLSLCRKVELLLAEISRIAVLRHKSTLDKRPEDPVQALVRDVQEPRQLTDRYSRLYAD
jgi:hypothetical protein